MTKISKRALQSGDARSLLQLVWMINPAKLQKALAKVDVEANDESDLDAIAEIENSQLKTNDGQSLQLGIVSLLNEIDFTPEEKQIAKSFNYDA